MILRMDTLSVRYNLRVTTTYGSQLENGSWNGLVGLVNRQVSPQKDY